MFGMHRRRGLRMWALSILARGPKNGAEIMNSIEEMSQGWWLSSLTVISARSDTGLSPMPER